MNTVLLPTLTADETRVLALITQRDGASEGEIMQALFPAPAYPENAPSGSPAANRWVDAHQTYLAKAHGGRVHRRDGSVIDETPYAETYSAKRFAITQRLTKLGLIREHNNGFNCYHWTAI